MLLFLVAVVRIGVSSILAALHALLEGVDDHHQFRRLLKQRVEGLAAFATGIGHAHRVLAGSFERGSMRARMREAVLLSASPSLFT
jgi:hypothetical protein